MTSRADLERRSYRTRRDAPGSVSYRPSELGSWIADVKVDGRRRTLGRYNTKAAAEAALRAHAAGEQA